MKITKMEKDIQKLRDKIADLQAQLKEKERQKVEMENTEIVDAVRGTGVNPEDLAAFIKAYQVQQSQTTETPVSAAEPVVEESPPMADTTTAYTADIAADDSTADSGSETTSYTSSYGSTSYDYNSGSEGGYRYEDSDD